MPSAILDHVQVFAGSQLSHWDFPRNTASAALMTGFGTRERTRRRRSARRLGICPRPTWHDHGRTIVGRQELAIATNLVNLHGASGATGDGPDTSAGAADLGIRVGAELSRRVVRHFRLSRA